MRLSADNRFLGIGCLPLHIKLVLPQGIKIVRKKEVRIRDITQAILLTLLLVILSMKKVSFKMIFKKNYIHNFSSRRRRATTIS